MKSLWNKWKLVAEKIGNFQFQIIFSIFYYLFITPLGLLTASRDFLKTKKAPSWEPYPSNIETLEEAKKQ